MFTTNPFSELSQFIPPLAMQLYVIAMIVLVVVGTLLDMAHKGSAKYFFENAKKQEKEAKRSVGSVEKAGLAVSTIVNEVLTSSEFKRTQRRISHLFTMYGFSIFVLSTAVLIFGHAEEAHAGIWPLLWHLGALSLCFGGYWFWLFIRVDVSAEGVPWYRFTRGDIFIVSMLATCTFALIWSATQGGAIGWLFFTLFVASSTTLFSTVLWSKFAHMFFKPAAAYQKKLTRADGSRENLPAIYDLTDPAVHAKFPDVPEYMGKNPPYMGKGIKREAPRHY
ncbi:MAG: hypothetical protein P8X48_09500 [Acidiferrobacteraceae bacterium]|jgi:hypothetical protein